MTVYIAHVGDHRGDDLRQWDYAVSHWPVDSVCLFDEIPDGVTLVVMSPESSRYMPGNESLVDFTHPENCIYLFGSNNQHLTPDILPRTPDHVVYIPMPGYQEMFSWTALAVVMFDRAVKGG